jgi:hypothetical protein
MRAEHPADFILVVIVLMVFGDEFIMQFSQCFLCFLVCYFFNLSNPSSSTMALGSTQPLTEMSTGNLPGG